MAGTISPLSQTNLKTDLDNLSRDAFNKATQGINSAISGAGGSSPWSDLDSRFFKFIAIKPDRWDQLFPYRLLVIDANKGNSVVNGSLGIKATVSGSRDSAIVNFESLGKQWVFQLPISPQQLSITDQYAIQTSATLRGVSEEHSGLRFKTINASGTMGVWPYRQSITSPPSSPTVLQSIFGGTIEAAQTLVGQIGQAINIATSNHPASKPTSKRPETSPQGDTSTGYYAAMSLQQFLEQYAEAKKNPKNGGWRLVFDIPKQNTSYVVTPMQFVWQQNANKPLEIQYQLQLKAWRRIDLLQNVSTNKPAIQPLSPGILQRVLGTVSAARSVMSAATDLIGAVRSDVNTPLEVLRQISLFMKDISGTVITAADMPFQLQRDISSALKDSLNNLKTSISSTSSNPAVRSALSSISTSYVQTEGLSMSAVARGQIGSKAAQAQSIDPANNVFDSPEKNFDLINEVPVHSLELNPSQQAQVDSAIDDIRNITVDDLKQFRATVLELALQISNNYGAGDSYYNQIYGRATPNVRLQPMNLDEYAILDSLYDTMQSLDILTATTQVDDDKKKTNMEYVAGLADLSGINFQVPTSKILVPVPFGLTIESIAARYLGNAQRWLEIATLNNLRDPYIDEDGFQLSLLSNASGRQITITSVENLYVGQRVILRSSTQTPSPRRILGIDRLSDTSYLITLDGAGDLDSFITVDSAYLQAYLPGTVNSQQKIFIPSELDVPNDPNIVNPSSVSSDPLVGLSKVDWLLTDSGDIAINSYGDIRLAAGMTNLIQALKLKLATPKGSLITHPEYGLGLKAGVMTSEVNLQDIYNSLNKMIEEDPRFQGLDSLQIEINGPTLSISMGVNLPGQTGVFPVTFQLPA